MKGSVPDRPHHRRVPFLVVKRVSKTFVMPILRENIACEARLMTDAAGHYVGAANEFSGHESVNHAAGEYGRGDSHTNTVEGFYAIFKRGMKGV